MNSQAKINELIDGVQIR